MSRGKKGAPNTGIVSGWFYVAQHRNSNLGWLPPFVALSRADAILKSKLDGEATNFVRGPFGSRWEAWNDLQTWLNSGEKRTEEVG